MGFIKVIIYPIIIVLASLIFYKDYEKYCNKKIDRRISIKSLLIISFMVGIYSLSYNHTFWWGDVSYYDAFFSSGEDFKDSYGLNLIYSLLHNFTTNIDVLLFTIASLSTFIIILSYSSYEEAYPISVVMLFCTPFFIETAQVNLKQAIACGLASFAINSFLKNNYFVTFLFVAVSSLFHITALAILPLTLIAIAMISINNKHIKHMCFICLFICFIFFDKIFLFAPALEETAPELSSKMVEYSDSMGNLKKSSTGLIAAKGVPYYVIPLLGFIYRKKLVKSIKNYDGFLIVSLLATVSYLLSYYSYWMSRIINYYWMTIFVFLGIILTHLKPKSYRIIYKYFVGGLLFFFTMRQMWQMYLSKNPI